MTPLAATILLACLAIAGLKVTSVAVTYSFSTARRHRIEAKACVKAARHRAGRWVV